MTNARPDEIQVLGDLTPNPETAGTHGVQRGLSRLLEPSDC